MPKSVAGSLRRIRCARAFAITAFLCYTVSAAATTVWNVGDETTYNEGVWGAPATDTGAMLLTADFNTVYASQGAVIVGDTSVFTMVFTDSAAVLAYLPVIGAAEPLDSSVLNPTAAENSSGSFGGNVLALEFNVDFADAGFLPAASGIPFGDLVLEGITDLPQLDGLTVRQFLADMNTLLGGGSTIVPLADIDEANLLVNEVDGAFSLGTPDQFAQNNLVAPTVAATPEPSSLAMLVVGLLGVAATAHRKRRQG